ncbi:copia protein [Tanacetum coccineum]
MGYTQTHGNNGKITAFIGSPDLCDGRYNTSEHMLFHDLDTVFKDDIHQPTIPAGTKAPRQPWHDLHCKINSHAAHDVLFNFEQRWRKATKWRELALVSKRMTHCHCFLTSDIHAPHIKNRGVFIVRFAQVDAFCSIHCDLLKYNAYFAPDTNQQVNVPVLTSTTPRMAKKAVNVGGARDKWRSLTDSGKSLGFRLQLKEYGHSEDQKLEAHYMYMAQLQEVTPDQVDNSGPIFDDEPMHKLEREVWKSNCTILAMEIWFPELLPSNGFITSKSGFMKGEISSHGFSAQLCSISLQTQQLQFQLCLMDKATASSQSMVNGNSTPVQEQGETSSRHVDSSNMHTFYQHHPSAQRWTKDHPLRTSHGKYLLKSVRTRQLARNILRDVYVRTHRTNGLKTAFHYGPLKTKCNVNQTRLFADTISSYKVLPTQESIIWSQQAPRAWYDELSNFLVSEGFSKGSIDPTLFITKHEEDILLVQIYVDDIIFGFTNPKLSKRFRKLMHSKFDMSMMGS